MSTSLLYHVLGVVGYRYVHTKFGGGKRKGQAVAKLKEATKKALDRTGWERALIYKMLV